MNKKLTAKTQALNPKLPQYSNAFSQSMIIEPETSELLLKRGTVYTLFDVSGSSNFDTELITKVVKDVLHDTYFQSESISPIQSMEKAIVETRNKVTQLSSDTLTSNIQSINLNIIAGVLWGNVLYVVQYGTGKAYTMSEGQVTLMNMISEGNFSTASKVVNEEDVLIFCTNAFEEAFPPAKLLASSISEGQLQPNQTCLLMRLLIDTSLSEDEVINFGLEEAAAKSKARERAQKITSFAKSGFGVATGILKKGIGIVKPVGGKVKSLVKMPKLATSLPKPNVSKKSKKIIGMVVGGILLTVIIAGGIYALVTKKPKETPEPVQTEEVVELPAQEKPEEEPSISKEEQEALDAQQKVERVTPEVFYDLKIADSEANPIEIVAFEDKIVAVDRTSGKIFVSDIGSPSFTIEEQTFPGIKSAVNSEGFLSFNDDEGYKTYDLETSIVDQDYKIEDLELTFPYAGFIYAISGDILTKHSEEEEELTGVTWGQNPAFVGAKSLAINYSVFILTKDNKLLSFAAGAKTDFSVEGLEGGFGNPVKLVSDFDLENTYVADAGNKSIVVLDADGVFIKQFKHSEESTWDDIRGIAISTDETLLFVLNESKIFKVTLEASQ